MAKHSRTATVRWLGCLVVAITVGSLPGAAEKKDARAQVEGTWQVVSVEMNGQQVPGLESAELTLRPDGGKTFKLPSGTLEEGTYKLDPQADPGHIDSTTDGKPGTERGIYELKGDTLKLCLSTAGGTRPDSFATRAGTDLILIVLKRTDGAPPDGLPPPPSEPAVARSTEKPTGKRNFRMGFTGFVYDITPAAVSASRKFVRENGDLLAHHIEGVPWAESLSGKPYTADFLREWEGKKSATPANGKVYLAISPGRGELKPAEKAGPVPKELAGKGYDDPTVMKAYLNYCRRAIEFFKPDYLAIGIEVNEIHDAGPAAWERYAVLHRHVYAELKKEHPDLPVFASWTLHNMYKRQGKMLAAFQELMPQNDLVAVSYYPFFVPDPQRLSALDWMTEQFDPFKKPYAMVETNDAAERLPLPQAKVVIEGTPAKQVAYYEALLSMAQKREFAFVVSFVHQDYDALWDKIKATAPELFMAWRDCGLLDQDGKPRPAYDVWRAYFELPRTE